MKILGGSGGSKPMFEISVKITQMGRKKKNKRPFVSRGKKRKGLDILVTQQKEPTPSAVIWLHLSLEDCSRRKKKCKEIAIQDVCGSCKSVGSPNSVVTGVVTAPPCGSARSDPPGRGLKRKIGCIDPSTRLRRKKKIEQEYELGEIIGRGKFGSVMLCRSKLNGDKFACKTMRKGEDVVHREVEIMQHLSGHPGVVTLKAVYEDTESFHLVMELCSGGRLLDQMAKEGRYSEYQAANLIRELMQVIRSCHDMGVVHRDIKPENILLTTSGQIKLADFGLAVRISDGQSLTGIVGSPAYVAPEVLVGGYSEKVDIWSAGVLLHALLVGVLPFQGDSLEAVFRAIKKNNLTFSGGVWESISKPARHLISCMLTRNVSARYTAAEVLRHPWILFCTEPTLKILTFEPTTNDHLKLKSQLTSHIELESDRSNCDDSCPTSLSGTSTKAPEAGDSGLVDILSAAISRVKISEPKRSRLCSPARSSQQECPSNMKINSLCAAF